MYIVIVILRIKIEHKDTYIIKTMERADIEPLVITIIVRGQMNFTHETIVRIRFLNSLSPISPRKITFTQLYIYTRT